VTYNHISRLFFDSAARPQQVQIGRVDLQKKLRNVSWA
jgi:hypothetical protein